MSKKNPSRNAEPALKKEAVACSCTYHGGPSQVHRTLHVHDDRDHDQRMHQVRAVGDPAQRVEELAGEQPVHVACEHRTQKVWDLDSASRLHMQTQC
jgi:hypothetical protein